MDPIHREEFREGLWMNPGTASICPMVDRID
jgi:hypothetical protein